MKFGNRDHVNPVTFAAFGVILNSQKNARNLKIKITANQNAHMKQIHLCE